jgi:hypothetical protein
VTQEPSRFPSRLPTGTPSKAPSKYVSGSTPVCLRHVTKVKLLDKGLSSHRTPTTAPSAAPALAPSLSPSQPPTQSPTALELKVEVISASFQSQTAPPLVNPRVKVQLKAAPVFTPALDFAALPWQWSTPNGTIQWVASGPYLTVRAGQLMAGATYVFKAAVETGHTSAMAHVRETLSVHARLGSSSLLVWKPHQHPLCIPS